MLESVGINGVNAIPKGVQPRNIESAVEPVRSSENQSFYISSRLRMDNQLDVAILEFRSRETGDVIRQFPTEQQIRAFERASELELQRSETVETTDAFVSGGNNSASTTTAGDNGVGSASATTAPPGGQVDIIVPGASSLTSSASSATAPISTPAPQVSTAAPQVSGNSLSASLVGGGGSTGTTSTQSIVA